jgi:hypothetical protein
MRVLSFLFLVGFVAVLGYFAYENDRSVTLNVFGIARDVPVPLLVVAVYLLGMFSGWFVVGILKRSWQRMTEPDRR